MVNALLDVPVRVNGARTNQLLSVWNNSRDLCLQRYEKPKFTETDYRKLYLKSKKVFTEPQLNALKRLYEWRDEMARSEDESIGYVLPNHMMLQIAESLPRDTSGILACCKPIPPLVRQYLLQLQTIIDESRISSKSALDHAGKKSAQRNAVHESMQPTKQQHPAYHLLHSCPHDFSHVSESSSVQNIEPYCQSTGFTPNVNIVQTEDETVLTRSRYMYVDSLFKLFSARRGKQQRQGNHTRMHLREIIAPYLPSCGPPGSPQFERWVLLKTNASSLSSSCDTVEVNDTHENSYGSKIILKDQPDVRPGREHPMSLNDGLFAKRKSNELHQPACTNTPVSQEIFDFDSAKKKLFFMQTQEMVHRTSGTKSKNTFKKTHFSGAKTFKRKNFKGMHKSSSGSRIQ